MSNLEQNGPINQLLVESWTAYDRLCDESFIVRPAIPILFFGDRSRYLASPLRVVTVGLNPSGVEFPNEDRFARFPGVRSLGTSRDQRESSILLEALSA
jgi:hypothetical protein